MHTYTPTASHDPVVEFDNGDLGNQTNLNNMVRALGNRSQLAKETNDTQATAIGVLQSYAPRNNSPAILDVTASITATGNGGSYTGGEEVFSFSQNYLGGSDMGTSGSTSLDTVTYTGTGGGTKLIRVAPNSRYLIHVDIIVGASEDTGGPTPIPTEWAAAQMRVAISDDTAHSVNVATLKDITGIGHLSGDPANPQAVRFAFSRTIVVNNNSLSARYIRMRLMSPVNEGTFTAAQGSVVVQYVGFST